MLLLIDSFMNKWSMTKLIFFRFLYSLVKENLNLFHSQQYKQITRNLIIISKRGEQLCVWLTKLIELLACTETYDYPCQQTVFYLRQAGYIFWVVCLSVCLLATLRKNFWTDLREIFREVWQWAVEQMIKFWWQSGHRFGYGSGSISWHF